MTVIRLRAGQFGQQRADGEGRLGLAHENAGGDVERFGAADAHQAGHDPGGGADDELHDAQVIEDGEEGGHEDDGGQNGESEDEASLANGVGQGAEDEGGAVECVMEESVDGGAGRAHRLLPPIEFQDDKGEKDLEADAPSDDFPFDSLAVSGEGEAGGEDGENAQDAG